MKNLNKNAYQIGASFNTPGFWLALCFAMLIVQGVGGAPVFADFFHRKAIDFLKFENTEEVKKYCMAFGVVGIVLVDTVAVALIFIKAREAKFFIVLSGLIAFFGYGKYIRLKFHTLEDFKNTAADVFIVLIFSVVFCWGLHMAAKKYAEVVESDPDAQKYTDQLNKYSVGSLIVGTEKLLRRLQEKRRSL